MITTEHTQECLSLAFVHALTGAAGVNLRIEAGRRRHDYGIDGTFFNVKVMGSRHVEDGFPVDFQMKSTINWSHDEQSVIYDLDAQAYNDLVERDPNGVPCILILLCLPNDQTEWLTNSESELVLKKCCYWVHLTGDPTKNAKTRRIKIPRSNVLSVDGVRKILKIERERWPV